MTSKVDIKVVLLGKHDVGKSCLVERYLHGKFKDNTITTVGAAFGAKKVAVFGKTVTLGIWDTAGQERYESMSRIYYRSARSALVCYDLTDSSSFEKVKFWVDELLTNESGCSIYLVGTKSDLVTTQDDTLNQEVTTYAKSIGAKTFQTSAKTGEGVEEVFSDIANSFLQNATGSVSAPTVPANVPLKSPTGKGENTKKNCCAN